VKLEEGRFFDNRDAADGMHVAVVDRRFAQRFGNSESIIGKTFRINPRDPQADTVTIVGVIGPVMLEPPGDVPLPTLLVPLHQAPFKIASIAVRTRGAAGAFAPRLNALMHEIDADTPLYWMREYDAIVRDMSYGERLVTQRFGVFGLIALALSAASLYGVTTFLVLRRTREIGVRRALGAPGALILRGLFARVGAQLAAGLALGLGAGLAFARLLTQSLPAIAPSGALDVVGVVAVLAVAALLAVAAPAWRALRVDPMLALRHE
jgi:putative ABC transport system permease protein